MGREKGKSRYWQLNDYNWLYQKYVEEEQTSYQIADIIGCSQWAVVSALHKFGIPPRKRFIYKELQDAEWLHQEYEVKEFSAEKIAKKLGCHRITVIDALKRANITRRPGGSLKGEKNPCYGTHPSQATRDKQSKAKIGKYVGDKNPFYGKHHTEERKEEWTKKSKGKHSSPETEWEKGTLPWNTGKHPEGRPQTEAPKQKIGDASRARWQDEEFLKNGSKVFSDTQIV